MMTVSYIQVWDFFKLFGNGVYGFLVVYYPEMMAESVGSSEVIFRFSGGYGVYYVL